MLPVLPFDVNATILLSRLLPTTPHPRMPTSLFEIGLDLL